MLLASLLNKKPVCLLTGIHAKLYFLAMNTKTSLQKAVQISGGQVALARKLTEIMGRTIKQQHVWTWLNETRVLPAEYAIPIEKATDGQVSRYELRPDIYPDEAA